MSWHLDWISALLFMVAIPLVGRKLWYAWIFQSCGNLLLIVINLDKHLLGFLPLNLFAAVMYVRNGVRWYRER